jgi:hypothetical protein
MLLRSIFPAIRKIGAEVKKKIFSKASVKILVFRRSGREWGGRVTRAAKDGVL